MKRRNFLKTATAAGAGIIVAPQISKAGVSKSKQNKDEVNIGFIGVGGRGRGHLKRAAMTEGVKITAFCDIDPEAVKKTHKLMKDPSLPKEYFKNLWSTIKKGKVWKSKVRNIAKDGTLFIVKTKIVPVRNSSNNVIQYMAIREDITAKENAKYDALTNLFNRKQFDEIFDKLFEEAQHNNTDLSLVIVDADHFKSVNDNYGHQKGDEVLVHISKILTQNIRGDDLCARWGGEEFVVLLPGSSFQIAQKVANRMRESIQENIKVDNSAQTCSFGVSELSKYDTIETMFKRADEALYSAKKTGRNKVVYFEYKK